MHNIATAVDHMGIEIADLTQAVAAELKLLASTPIPYSPMSKTFLR